MPEEPRGRKRPTTRIGNAFRATRIGNAFRATRIGTGEAEEGREPESLAAVSGRRDGAARAGAFGADMDFARLVKLCGTAPETAKGRYGRAGCVGIRKRPVGKPIRRMSAPAASSARTSPCGCARGASRG